MHQVSGKNQLLGKAKNTIFFLLWKNKIQYKFTPMEQKIWKFAYRKKRKLSILAKWHTFKDLLMQIKYKLALNDLKLGRMNS